MSNLTQLNENLFNLFEEVKTGKVDLEKAKILNVTAGNIIKNAKTQLDALRLSDSIGITVSEIVPSVKQEVLPQKSRPVVKKENTPDVNPVHKKPASKNMREVKIEMDDFAVKLGYNDRLDAIRGLKEKGFNDLFNNRNQ